MTNQGVILWTPPSAGLYTITVAGASGGGADGTGYCRGAQIQTSVNITSATLKLVVGQRGRLSPSGCGSSGGGGGSFVFSGNVNSPLVVAGGGGGHNNFGFGGTYSRCDASLTSTSGNINSQGDGTSAGTGGYGGAGDQWGGGGGGLYGNGQSGPNCGGTGGFSIVNQALGGDTCYDAPGGFGGGGGTHGCTGGGGGGGGYSGGAAVGQDGSYTAGGGGSFCINGLGSALCSSSYHSGDGFITITRSA